MIRRWIVNGALPVLVFVMVWVVMVAIWRADGRTPGVSDMLLYLVGLPVVLVLGAVAVRKGVSALVAARPGARGAQAAADAMDTQAQDLHAAHPVVPLAMVRSAMRVAHGSTAAELRQAWEGDEANPALDPVLRDRDGFPVLSYRVADVDEEVPREMLADWRRALGMPELEWRNGQLRALALGGDVVSNLAESLAAHPALQRDQASAGADSTPAEVPMLQVVAILPTEWEPQTRQAAGHWFLHLIEQQGWPRGRLCLSVPSRSHAAGTFEALDRLAARAGDQEQGRLGLLIACASYIDEQTLVEWDAAGRLHTSRNADAEIPGEGAAGLLLADAEQAAMLTAEAFPAIHAPVRKHHEKPASGNRRVAADLLVEMAKEALAAASAEVEQITLLAADSDHRASRVAELYELAEATFPDLDVKSQCLASGHACGSMGAVGGVLALALCCDEVMANAGSALCISNDDASERVAAVVRPYPLDTPALVEV